MEDVRPTAKWANRMLRPLTSVYHRLEKHHEILASIADSKLKEQAEARRAGQNARSTTATTGDADKGYSYSDEEPGDPAWAPGKPDKRRIRHNYASRGQKGGIRRRSRLSIHSPERQKTLPGAIEIATPLITGKARGNLECSSLRKQLFRSPLDPANTRASGEPRRASRTINASFPAYQGSWKEVLDLSGDTGLVDIAHTLDRILLKFLGKTRVGAAGERSDRGARSLMSMVARRLPDFIAEEQRLQDGLKDDDCDGNMCDAYFTELEAHYAPFGHGWGPLREAVRAQGIHLVSEMMHQGWLTPFAACRLMEECMNHGEFDAFESLMSRYLTTVDQYDYPMAFEPPKPPVHHDDAIYILGKYCFRAAGRRSFVFEELAKLLRRGTVPPEWMVTTLWKKCVDGAIKSVSIEDCNAAAATRLVEAVVLSAGGVYPSKPVPMSRMEDLSALRLGRPRGTRASSNATVLAKGHSPCPVPIQDALSNLTSSLIAALCGMSIARSQAPTDDVRATGVKVRNTVGYLTFAVQRAVGTHHSHDGTLPMFQSLRRGYVLLGDLMLRCGADPLSVDVIDQLDAISRRNIQAFFLSLAGQHEMLKGLAELVRQVFRCCGHADKTDESRTSRETRRKVSELAQLSDLHGVSVFLGNVAAETAMAFAETTLDTDDHAWAMEIQEMVVSARSQRDTRSPSSHSIPYNDTGGLYRWEESIGEWVARTPMPKPKAGQLEVASKQALARPRLPSTIACSTSSTSTSSSQEDAVSSVTSSPPSVPMKRTWTNENMATRSRKRLRPDPTDSRAARGIRSRSHRSPSEAGSCESEYAPIAARTRGARGTLAEVSSNVAASREMMVQDSDSEEITPKVEVVIVNRRSGSPSDTESLEDFVEPISERTRPTMRRQSLRLKPPRGRRHTAPPGIICRRATGLPRVIPCSQDDESDDELSFL